MATDLNLFLAFGAGFLSFISPCTLPLYPAFISYITGMSLDDLKSDSKRMSRSGTLHTLFFLIGFSIIFVVLGFATSLVGTFFVENQEILRQLGAVFMVLFGLMIAGVYTPKFLMGEKKLQFKNRPSGYFGSVLIGLAFAAGWTPCSGPIIGVIMGLSATNPGSGVIYMLMYVFGFAIPFFVLSFFITRLGWIRKNSGLIMKIGGAVMIAFGILLFFDGLTYLTSLLSPIFGDFQGF
ncbi:MULTISPECIES: cytochrome c biogenesis CcdA family protein [Sporosarcina]|uniref:Cytochrome c-type biogenesis protein n=1 Tax=Sporosarcina psychrophila TaxID=1476 RepID=A0ABV2K7A3_SPOPS|nr:MULTISPECIES: cytochrome c biogenesis protein CcdA [Sporosarcina]AMQ06430.1 cytochrome C biogenesis protein CcdA [Sporosarcina psychrophila]QNK86145.1 sulfite exporter TauE/SafE family protein [Sporosarcina sp. resist]